MLEPNFRLGNANVQRDKTVLPYYSDHGRHRYVRTRVSTLVLRPRPHTRRGVRIKENLEEESYIGAVTDWRAVRLRFRLRSCSAGLGEDERRCKMCAEDRCILCGIGALEEEGHFLLDCRELESPREKLKQDQENLAKEDDGVLSELKEYGRSGKIRRLACARARVWGSVHCGQREAEQVYCVMENVWAMWERTGACINCVCILYSMYSVLCM